MMNQKMMQATKNMNENKVNLCINQIKALKNQNRNNEWKNDCTQENKEE